MSRLDKKQLEADRQIRTFSHAFARQGIELRREKLSRGQAFRVKSGDCVLTGKPRLFLDRRLPADQQLSLLVDYVLALSIPLNDEELESLPAKTRQMLNQR